MDEVQTVGAGAEGAPAARTERHSSGRRLAREVSGIMIEAGWTREHFPGWNVVTAFEDLVRDLMDEAVSWHRHTGAALTRGERRDAKRVVWALVNTLRDLRVDRDEVLKRIDEDEAPAAAADPERLGRMIDHYMAGYALCTRGTHVRALFALQALRRLSLRLVELEVTLPIGRVRAGAPPGSAADGRGVRREGAPEGSSVDSVCESESENRDEDGPGSSAVRSARPPDALAGGAGTREESDDDDGFG